MGLRQLGTPCAAVLVRQGKKGSQKTVEASRFNEGIVLFHTVESVYTLRSLLLFPFLSFHFHCLVSRCSVSAHGFESGQVNAVLHFDNLQLYFVNYSTAPSPNKNLLLTCCK